MTALLSIADNCEDILNADMDCSLERTFTDRESMCVDASAQPAPCRCGGAATQNSFTAMQAALSCLDVQGVQVGASNVTSRVRTEPSIVA